MSQEEWKRNAAKEAANLAEDEMTVGLGSGSTLAEIVKVLGEEESEADFVSASIVTQQLADKMDLNLISLDEDTKLDFAIDGADEIDPNFSMIKGGGGAHTREKIVASAAEKVAIVVDKTKLVENLGEDFPVPVEVVPFAYEYIGGILEEFGEGFQLRESPGGGPFVTDNGNYILDLEVESIENPSKLEEELNQVPGVVENGLFVDVADSAFVGYEDGCEVLESKEDFSEFMD